MNDFDVCIVGSGAGAAPVAYTLAQAGKKVLVLEKGPWLNTEDFSKDELGVCHRSFYTPNLQEEQHVIEEEDSSSNSGWSAATTFETGWDFWNGNMVGGSSNLMSGYFHRIKPVDFKLLSTFGVIDGANIVDWPIGYDEMEPYFARVEQIIGVSGTVVPHPHLEPRSTHTFPFPALNVNKITTYIEKACNRLGYNVIPTPRAIISQPFNERNSCYYSNFCGSYGCSSDAKSSARAALLNQAIKSGNCTIWPHSKVTKLLSDSKGKISAVVFYDKRGKKQTVKAKRYVVACQAIETARLLLQSTGEKHPEGIGNNHNQLGKNLIFSGGGKGQGYISYSQFSKSEQSAIATPGLFINRALQDWYTIDTPQLGKAKGGTIDFLWQHANGITRANKQKWDSEGNLVWGKPLKRKLEAFFGQGRFLQYEVFNDWLPTDNCFVSLDGKIKDKWGDPVARVRVGAHPQDVKIGAFLADKGEKVLKEMGATHISQSISSAPPANLQAGGCRFGEDISTSVLNAECRVHDAENLFVTDGSFMPTGGSVPFTFTIYANAFRVADIIKNEV